MADIESLSFALLIPFSICFVLVFLVCCFADQLKTLCRFPSSIPTNYVSVTSPRRHHRSRGRFRTAHSHLVEGDETRILIRNQEERSRNSSESLNDLLPSVLTVIPEHGRLVIHQGQILCPQTVFENGQIVQYPSQIIPHTVMLNPATNCYNISSQTSTPSLLQTNFQTPASVGCRTGCSLPSITEKVESKNNLNEVSVNVSTNNLNNRNSDSQRRSIRNLPEIITVDLLSHKK